MSQRVVTDYFTVPRGAYERYVSMRWLKRRWWVVALPLAVIAAAAAATADYRWLLVMLIYALLVAPFVIVMAYFRDLLTPMARLTALRKRLALEPGREIVIEYAQGEEVDDGETAEPRPPERIPWSEVTAITESGRWRVIELSPTPYPRFILAPRELLNFDLTTE